MADIFISYTRSDRSKAEQLARALEAQGWSVWWDRKIPAGRTFDRVIEEELKACKCVVVLWSKKSVVSDWVREEAGKGKNRSILMPVLLEKVEIPIGFGRIQASDLSAWNGEANASVFISLVNDIKALFDRSRKSLSDGIESQEPTGKVDTTTDKAPAFFWLRKSKIRPKTALISLGTAVTVVVILFCQIVSPRISRYYVRQGNAAQAYEALNFYQRAIGFDPNNMQARFRLGVVYEELQNIPEAQLQYQKARLGGCVEAYNHLAHLYIVHNKNYSDATTLLWEGQHQLLNRDNKNVTFCSQAYEDNPINLEYLFHTNLGWALLLEGNLEDSEKQLKEAMNYVETAAPHCLLAQVLEGYGRMDDALSEWEDCRLLATKLNPDEKRWLEMARKRLP